MSELSVRGADGAVGADGTGTADGAGRCGVRTVRFGADGAGRREE